METTEMRRCGYRTNDKVQLEGTLSRASLKRLWVNGFPPVYLGMREYLVMLALVQHAQRYGSEFCSNADLLKRVDALRASAPEEVLVLENMIDCDIVKLIHKLRKRLPSPHLIETCRGHGYRLSCPAENLDISPNS